MKNTGRTLITSLVLSAFLVAMASNYPSGQKSVYYEPPRESFSPLTYLNSFSGASLSLNDDVYSFSGSQNVYRLFDFQAVESPQVMGYWVNYDITYIPTLDLGFIDISYSQTLQGNAIATDTIFAYPFEYGDHFRDSTFVLNDVSFRGTDFVYDHQVKTEYAYDLCLLNAHSVVSQAIFIEAVSGVSFSYGDGSGQTNYVPTAIYADTAGVVYPAIEALEAIASFDDTVGFARSKFPVPNFIELDSYVAYWVKMMTIEKNFKNNIIQSIPITLWLTDHVHINNQLVLNRDTVGWVFGNGDYDYAWANWWFGFNNMANAGCAVFATYNLLIDLGYQVNLAVLIALFELANADLLYASIGGCPLSEQTINELKAEITILLVGTGIGLSFIPVVGTAFFFASISLTVTINAVVDVFFNNQRGLEDILDCLGISSYYESMVYSSYLYTSFKQGIDQYQMGIVCFWNGVDNNLNIDLTGGAHYVYVGKDSENYDRYIGYNVGCTHPESCCLSNLYAVMKPYYDYSMAERATIAFYVIL